MIISVRLDHYPWNWPSHRTCLVRGSCRTPGGCESDSRPPARRHIHAACAFVAPGEPYVSPFEIAPSCGNERVSNTESDDESGKTNVRTSDDSPERCISGSPECGDRSAGNTCVSRYIIEPSHVRASEKDIVGTGGREREMGATHYFHA